MRNSATKNSAVKCFLTLGYVILATLAILALFLAVVKTTGNVGYVTTQVEYKIFEDFNSISDLSRALMSFSIITAILVTSLLVCTVLEMFKVLKTNKIKKLIGILTFACAIIAFVLTFVFCSENALNLSIGSSQVKSFPAVGCYLTFASGVLASVLAFVPTFNKRKK